MSAEGERVGGRDGRVGGKGGGRYVGGVNSRAFGERVEKFDETGTAVHGERLVAAGGEW